MKKVLVLSVLLLLVSSYGSALQGAYTYTALSGWMWDPWSCVVEQGSKWDGGVYKGFAEGPEAKCEKDGFVANECPFGAAAINSFTGGSLFCPGEGVGPEDWGLVSKVTVPEDFKLVFSDGRVVGDEVCVGDTFSLDKGVNKGEWWSDGGYDDSPPIFWVDDVEKLTDELIAHHKNNPMSKEEVSTYSYIPLVGYVDPLTNVPIFYVNGSVFEGIGIFGNLVCSIKQKDTGDTSMPSKGGVYTADKAGTTIVSAQYIVECMFYYYGEGFDEPDKSGEVKGFISSTIKNPMVIQNGPNAQYMLSLGDVLDYASKEDFFRVGTIGINKTIRVVDPAKPQVDVSVAGSDNIKLGESNTLRLLVKNTGDTGISIKSVYSKPSGKLVSCDAETLAPGKQAECLLSVMPVQGQGLSVEVSYDYESCGRSQVGLVTKTLIDSKTLRPVLKEQSYLMGVHGACDNSYYSCHSASEGSLYAGYKCYKTSNNYFAPAVERFNLRFDLSEIPKNAEILGARLYLKASEVGGKQTINVYSVDKIPEVVKCLPGGDICTQPYCGECKPLYDLDGTVASSADISSAGQYSFDVTSLVKEKSAGDGIISMQVRGAEGVWESQGQGSCSLENQWDKKDVSFDAGGRDGLYLEVAYN